MLIAPLDSPFRVTQRFGGNPKMYEKLGMKGHNGIDFGCKVGTPVYAPMDGLAWTGKDPSGYGDYVKIVERDKTDGKRRKIVLGHLSEFKVQKGTFVRAGDLVGLSGNTGHSTAPHLHMDISKVDDFDRTIDNDNGYKGRLDIYGQGFFVKRDKADI